MYDPRYPLNNILPGKAIVFFRIDFEERILFCPRSPLLRLLLRGLAGPEVLPPLLQHVGVENDRA